VLTLLKIYFSNFFFLFFYHHISYKMSGRLTLNIIPGSALDKLLKSKGKDTKSVSVRPAKKKPSETKGLKLKVKKGSDLEKALKKKGKDTTSVSLKPALKKTATKAEKKKAIAKLKKKLKALKKKDAEEAKRALLQESPDLSRITGLTKAEANKLSPLELFGLLPKELSLNIVLNPKATGVKVGEPQPYTKAQADMINAIFEEIYQSEGARQYVLGWSIYGGGNFNELTNEVFEDYSEALGKRVNDILEKTEKELNAERVRKTGREYGMDLLKRYGITNKYGQEWYYNEDFQVYDVEDALGLIYEDGEYYSSNVYKSETRKFLKDYADDLKKIAIPKLAELKKSLKK